MEIQAALEVLQIQHLLLVVLVIQVLPVVDSLDLRMLQVRLLLELLDQAAFHSVGCSLFRTLFRTRSSG